MKRNHEVVYNGKTFKRVQVLTALREIGNGREFFMVPEKAPEEFFFNEKHLAKGPIFGGRWPFNTRSSLLLVANTPPEDWRLGRKWMFYISLEEVVREWEVFVVDRAEKIDGHWSFTKFPLPFTLSFSTSTTGGEILSLLKKEGRAVRLKNNVNCKVFRSGEKIGIREKHSDRPLYLLYPKKEVKEVKEVKKGEER